MSEQQPHIVMDKAEEEFRQKRVWHSFKAVLYTGLSTASFFGVLGKLVDMAVTAVNTGTAGMLTNVPAMAVMGGFLAAGTVFTYLAQQEWTDVRCREDERLARKNAECMRSKAPEPAVQQAVEYAQNKRIDGKQWQQVVVPNKEQQIARV